MSYSKWTPFLLFVLVACGSDKKPSDDDTKRCGQAGTYAGYTGVRNWSVDDFEKCDALCPGLMPESCVQDNCPGAATFFACIDEELYACQTARGGDCRSEYEAYACCAEENCGKSSGAKAYACLMEFCSGADEAVEACYFPAEPTQGFETCVDKAYDRCLAGEVTPPRACTGDEAAPLVGFTGQRTWTRAWSIEESLACAEACAEAPSRNACMEAECPGATQYQLCVYEERAACSTETGGACRGAWQTVHCCAQAECGNTTGATFGLCLQTACEAQLEAFAQCSEREPSAACAQHAETACAPNTTDAGTDDAGIDDDAGVDDDAGAELDAGLEDGGLDAGGENDAGAQSDAGSEPDAASSELDSGTNGGASGSELEGTGVDAGPTETALPRLLPGIRGVNQARLRGLLQRPAAQARPVEP